MKCFQKKTFAKKDLQKYNIKMDNGKGFGKELQRHLFFK